MGLEKPADGLKAEGDAGEARTRGKYCGAHGGGGRCGQAEWARCWAVEGLRGAAGDCGGLWRIDGF